MRPLRYSINVSLDGCVDHASTAFVTDAELHQHAADWMARADVGAVRPGDVPADGGVASQ